MLQPWINSVRSLTERHLVELRNRIYDLVIAEKTETSGGSSKIELIYKPIKTGEKNGGRLDTDRAWAAAHHGRQYMGLIQVCRKLRREFRPLYLKGLPVSALLAPQHLGDYLATFGLNDAALATGHLINTDFTDPLPKTGLDVLPLFKALQEVVISSTPEGSKIRDPWDQGSVVEKLCRSLVRRSHTGYDGRELECGILGAILVELDNRVTLVLTLDPEPFLPKTSTQKRSYLIRLILIRNADLPYEGLEDLPLIQHLRDQNVQFHWQDDRPLDLRASRWTASIHQGLAQATRNIWKDEDILSVVIAPPEDEHGFGRLGTVTSFQLKPSLRSSVDELKKRISWFLNRNWMVHLELVTTEWCCGDWTCEWVHGWSDGRFWPAELLHESEQKA
jgi:hypothetical protein